MGNETKTANSYQVDGKHYRSDYQHWDWVADLHLNYFVGVATKYVTRWRVKAGGLDLRKAKHLTVKFKELLEAGSIVFVGPPDSLLSYEERKVALTERFAAANNLGDRERSICYLLAVTPSVTACDVALALIDGLIEEADSQQAAPTPAPVPLSEENHYAERVDRFEFAAQK